MKNKKFLLISLIILSSVVLVSYKSFFNKNTLEPTVLKANGTLEFIEINISSEVSGKVEKLLIEEGQEVKNNQVLAIINSDILKAQLLQSKANLESNKARLKSLETGARKQEIKQAEANLEQAKISLKGAEKTYKNSIDIYNNRSQQKQLLDSAFTQYKTLKSQYDAVKSNYNQVEISLKNAETNLKRNKKLFSEDSLSQQQLDLSQTQYDTLLSQLNSSKANINQVKSSLEGADINYKNVKDIYENRSQQKQQIINSETQVDIAKTNIQIAENRLSLLKDFAKKEDLDVLRANVLQAEAVKKMSETQLSKVIIKSPLNGIVLQKNIENGENIVIGNNIATIADISKIWLKIFIPENQIGRVKLGQKVNVKVDSFNDKVFTGEVKQINSKAEFTPRNVQTKEERVNQVFSVKVLIPNKEKLLKSGMPSDAELVEG
ncbi:MAG: efflux RND transporter periplasmic adaptor subunit [Candidatus Sericytochromatia bacterium]